MKELIKSSLDKAITYNAYFKQIEQSIENDQPMYESENLNFYNKLNYQRMKRLNKTSRLSDGFLEAGRSVPCKLIWLVITEGWCGDAAQIVPVLNKMASEIDNLELKLIYRDQHLELMDKFLTNGGRSIPKVIIIDATTLEVKGDWGPRPKPAQDMFMVYKNNKLDMDYKEVQAEMQKWYLKDKSENIQKELQPMLDLCK
ncbi:MAG: thioredoxin family protein [Cyclobacteriaceae bacterium]